MYNTLHLTLRHQTIDIFSAGHLRILKTFITIFVFTFDPSNCLSVSIRYYLIYTSRLVHFDILNLNGGSDYIGAPRDRSSNSI